MSSPADGASDDPASDAPGAARKAPSLPRAALSWLGPIVVLSIVTSLAALLWVMRVVLPAWNTPHTTIEDVPHAPLPTPRAPAIARRLAVVMVDGLGAEDAQRLDGFAELRKEGAYRTLLAHYPTFTGPNVTAMMTGLAPRESGVRLNGVETGATGTDDVLHAAWDAGIWLRVRGRTYAPFDALSRAPAQADVRRGRLQVPFDWAVDQLRPPPTATPGTAVALDLLYFGDVDDEGHRAGSRSIGYLDASRRAARFVERTRQQLDPEQDVLIVLSDHGHRAAGGHGGPEPVVGDAFLLAWGHRVRRGQHLPSRPMRDVASTLALVVGARTPSSNLGAPMIDLFDLDEREAARSVVDAFEQVSTFACGMERTATCDELAALRPELERERGAARAVDLLGRLARERDERADAAERSAKLWRLAAGMGAALLFVLLARVGHFAWPAARSGFLAPALMGVTYVGVLLLMGYRPTLSTMTQVSVFFADAGVAGAVAVIVTLLVAARLRWGLREAAFTCLASFTFMLPLWAAAGASPQRLGPPLASVLVFMLSPLVAHGAMAAVGIAIIAFVRSLGAPLALSGAGRG